MIERNYFKDATSVQQELKTLIDADKQTIFHLLATTEGITKWFPQLSIEDEQVLFDLGDGSFEKMRLLDYQTNDHISYEWAAGKIHFQLDDVEQGTQLILKEALPNDFKAFPEDFTGWYVQMKNVKNTAENGEPIKFDKEEIKEVKKSIIEQLGQ
jgi:hypothetical protein